MAFAAAEVPQIPCFFPNSGLPIHADTSVCVFVRGGVLSAHPARLPLAAEGPPSCVFKDCFRT